MDDETGRDQPSVGTRSQSPSRRDFLTLMGASLGLAGLTGCIRMPEEKLAPYAHRPNNRLPGVPVSYATAMEIGGIGQGLLVTSVDGRPIKIEGNPSHPLNRGAADAIAQASILGLYDPDRSRGVIRRSADGTGREAAWEEFSRWAKTIFKGNGKGICVLSEASSSPSVARLRQRFRKAWPAASWFQYEPLSHVGCAGESWPQQSDAAAKDPGPSFAKPAHGVLELSRAKVILSLDADLFGGGGPMAIKYARDFAEGRRLRKPGDGMNRLYVVESVSSITGACADHRRALRPSAIEQLVFQLAAALGVARFQGKPPDSGIDPKFFGQLKADLETHRGESLVVVGPRQPYMHRLLAAEINRKLGNVGKTVVYYSGPAREASDERVVRSLHDWKALEGVKTLLILGGNPVYNAPSDVRFGELLTRVKNTIHLGMHDDETSQLCQWHLSQAHYLESWGDVRTYDGTVSVVQPLIEPLFDGRSAIEVLAMILGDAPDAANGYEIVRSTFRSLPGEPFSEWKWKKALAEGVVKGTAWKPALLDEVKTAAAPGAAGSMRFSVLDAIVAKDRQPPSTPAPLPRADEGSQAIAPLPEGEGSECELVFFSDGKIYDGRFANNGWLQELPDPMTRLTWDNAALMSPETAGAIGVTQDELVRLRVVPGDHDDSAAAEVEFPVLFQPDMPDHVIAVALGYGRTAAGRVGHGVGQNAYALRWLSGMGWRPRVNATPTGKTYPLATVQEHQVSDAVGKRALAERVPELVREATLADYRRDPSLGIKKPAGLSIFDEHRFDGRPEGETKMGTGAASSSLSGEARPQDLAEPLPVLGVPAHDCHRWGVAVDLTACTGCGACVTACQAENNIPIVGKEQVLLGREMHWIRVDRYYRETPRGPRAVHQPVLCMQCENAPCEEVCPVAATTHSQEGLNMMTYNRCVGTRYCSNNCPYKTRRFNFFDYNRGLLTTLYEPNLLREPMSELLRMQKNPQVTVRMRGVMEKCTYCIQRIENARIAARREGDRAIEDGEIQTACQQSCPTQAIVFGDLNDPNSRVSKLHALPRTYGLLDRELNTRPRTRYVAKVRNA